MKVLVAAFLAVSVLLAPFGMLAHAGIADVSTSSFDGLEAAHEHGSVTAALTCCESPTPLPDAQAVLDLVGVWVEDYNDNHPHSGLKMRSPREFIAAQTATA